MPILRTILAVTGVSGLVATTAHYLPSRPERAEMVTASSASSFRFAAVERGSIEQTVTVTGTLQPVKTVDVGSQLSGQISRLYVDFNDTVRKGQPLAQIDPRTFKAKVDEGRAGLSMARANVQVTQAKLDRAKIDLENARGSKAVLAAKLENVQALKALAGKTLERKRALQLRNIEAATTLEQVETDLASKAAQEREAKLLVALNAYSVDGAEADVHRIEAELDHAMAAVPEKEATLAAAEADLDRTIIRAPIDGVIVGRFVDEGQTLAVGLESRTTFTVAHRLEDMETHARIDEADIGRIAPGQRAQFTVDAYPNRRFTAVVRQVRKAPTINQNVVTYTVVLSTSNPDGALLPGMTAMVRIIIEKQEDVLKVPLAALRFRPIGQLAPGPSTRSDSLWVRTNDGSIKQVPVSVGSVGPDHVAIRSDDLAEGNEVVVGQAAPSAGPEWFGIKF